MKAVGAKAWKPALIDAGPEWRVSATCPKCGRMLHWNVQPGTEEFQVWCHADDTGANLTLEA